MFLPVTTLDRFLYVESVGSLIRVAQLQDEADMVAALELWREAAVDLVGYRDGHGVEGRERSFVAGLIPRIRALQDAKLLVLDTNTSVAPSRFAPREPYSSLAHPAGPCLMGCGLCAAY